MSGFIDEPTPLPAPARPQRDPRFPTGYVPKIDITELDDPADGDALYATWRFSSPCRTLDEIARLHAPYFDGNSMHLFTADVRPAGETVSLELVLATGQRVLAGIATVAESLPAGDSVYGRPGMRFAFKSIDSVSAKLLDELGENAAPIRELVASAAAELDDAQTLRVIESFAPVRDDATTKMSRLEISDLLGIEHAAESTEWSELLMCTLAVSTDSRAERYAPDDHDASESVVAPDDRAAPDELDAGDDTDMIERAPTLLWQYRWWIVVVVAALGVLAGLAIGLR